LVPIALSTKNSQLYADLKEISNKVLSLLHHRCFGPSLPGDIWLLQQRLRAKQKNLIVERRIEMRYKKSLSTQQLLGLALSSDGKDYAVNRGEQEVGVFLAPTGEIFWLIDNIRTTEPAVAEVLARWAVEGVEA
jgi:hypothetical protein